MKRNMMCFRLLLPAMIMVSPVQAATLDLDSDDDGLIEIYTLADLAGIENDRFGTSLHGSSTGCNSPCSGYELMNDLDFDADGDGSLSDEAYWNGGAGWRPLGSTGDFAATFEGNGHKIRNLYINRPTTDFVGLFSTVSGGTIRNLSVEAPPGGAFLLAGKERS